MNGNPKCPICGTLASRHDYDAMKMLHSFDCPRCGKYVASYEFASDFPNERISDQQKAMLSGYTREKSYISDKNGNTDFAQITNGNYQNIITSDPLIPKTLSEKIYKLLNYLNNTAKEFGQEIQLSSPNDCSITYSKSYAETASILKELSRKGLIKTPPENTQGSSTHAALTVEGVSYLENQNNEKRTNSTQIFIALAFKSGIKKILDNGQLSNVIKEATGFEIKSIDKIDHVNKICDQIVTEINRSRAIIVDVTDGNQGAYYEAGYAHGLNLPVFFICKDGDVEKGKKYIDQVHFDTRQYSHILYKDEADLIKQLIYKINAVLGRVK